MQTAEGRKLAEQLANERSTPKLNRRQRRERERKRAQRRVYKLK